MDELITKRDAIEAVNDVLAEYIPTLRPWQSKIPLACAMKIKAMPPVQPDEKLEKCRFEYINACRTVTYPTQDTTKKDISDAHAVIKALQPIFGDVPFAKVERGGKE